MKKAVRNELRAAFCFTSTNVLFAQNRNVVCLQALVRINHAEANQLALAQYPTTTSANSTEVNEDFISAVTNDKAESFFNVEPLYSAFLVAFRAVVIIVGVIIGIVLGRTLIS